METVVNFISNSSDTFIKIDICIRTYNVSCKKNDENIVIVSVRRQNGNILLRDTFRNSNAETSK